MDELEGLDNRSNDAGCGLDPAPVDPSIAVLLSDRSASSSEPNSPSVESHRLIGGLASPALSEASFEYSSDCTYESADSNPRSVPPTLFGDGILNQDLTAAGAASGVSLRNSSRTSSSPPSSRTLSPGSSTSSRSISLSPERQMFIPHPGIDTYNGRHARASEDGVSRGEHRSRARQRQRPIRRQLGVRHPIFGLPEDYPKNPAVKQSPRHLLQIDGLTCQEREDIVDSSVPRHQIPRRAHPPPAPQPEPTFYIRRFPIRKLANIIPREEKREGLRQIQSKPDPLPPKTKDQIYLEKLAQKFASRANYMPPRHPTYLKMVILALRAINKKRGATKDTILRYLKDNFYMSSYDSKTETYLCNAIKKLIEKKRILTSKAKGFRGRFRLATERVLQRKIRTKPKEVKKPEKVVEIPMNDAKALKRLPPYEKMIVQTLKGLEKRGASGCNLNAFVRYFQTYYTANGNANRIRQYCEKALNRMMERDLVMYIKHRDMYIFTSNGRLKATKEAYLPIYLFASELMIERVTRIHYQQSTEIERARHRLRDYITYQLTMRPDGSVL